MSTAAFNLYCTVCKKSFVSRSEWLNHLVELYHQRRARQALSAWGSSERECVLVAFASGAVDRFELLSVFTTGETLVTDYVWFEDKPRVGLLQFESREMVNEVLSKYPGSEVSVLNQRVQLKVASSYLELEWCNLFGIFLRDNVKGLEPNAADTHSALSAVNRKRPYVHSPHSDLYNEESNKQIELDDYFNGLVKQFKSICDEILIPISEYNGALDIMRRVKDTLSPHAPGAKVLMFRHWYLRIKNPGTNELLIFADCEGIWGPDEWREERKPGGVSLLNHLCECPEFFVTPKKDLPQESDTYGTCFTCNKTGLKFRISFTRALVPEIQTCRLVRYFCRLDSRVHPLLILINYWAKVNAIQFSSSRVSDFRNPFHTPEPSALEWLVIMFLSNKGVVPSVRDVLKRPHRKIIFGPGEVDVGFSDNSPFTEECPASTAPSHKLKKKSKDQDPITNYTEEDIDMVCVIKLAREFFAFYWSLEHQSIVLNTKDGEVVQKSDLLHKKPEDGWTTKLTNEELCMLKNMRYLNSAKINLLHPFHLKWGFSFRGGWFFSKMMKTTAIKLSHFLNKSKNTETDLKSLLLVNGNMESNSNN